MDEQAAKCQMKPKTDNHKVIKQNVNQANTLLISKLSIPPCEGVKGIMLSSSLLLLFYLECTFRRFDQFERKRIQRKYKQHDKKQNVLKYAGILHLISRITKCAFLDGYFIAHNSERQSEIKCWHLSWIPLYCVEYLSWPSLAGPSQY